MSTPRTYMDFEKSIAKIDNQIESLLETSGDPVAITTEIESLQIQAKAELEALYANLGPWEKTKVARHPARPHFRDYCAQLITDYTPLSGDRKFGNDEALQGGLGKISGQSVVVMGHEKGFDTDSRVRHNFGMAQPEGYRKAVRLMDLAERFKLPIISFVDTAGAYPGRGAEERGQAEAIARCIDRGLSVRVPFVTVITGEGGSGGAVAIATADKVMMLEHSIYSVISPEGCASILWRDASKAEDAAKAMKITAQNLKQLKIIDEIILEPVGGAHRDSKLAIEKVGKNILKALEELGQLDTAELMKRRRAKFLNIGRSLL